MATGKYYLHSENKCFLGKYQICVHIVWLNTNIWMVSYLEFLDDNEFQRMQDWIVNLLDIL